MRFALVAHDNKKEELFEWAKFNCKLLSQHSLYATGATGRLLESRLGLNVTHLESGPLGGDQQIGSRISEGEIDIHRFARAYGDRDVRTIRGASPGLAIGS